MNDYDVHDPWKEFHRLDDEPDGVAFRGGEMIGRMLLLLIFLVAALAIFLAGVFCIAVAVRLARVIWGLS